MAGWSGYSAEKAAAIWWHGGFPVSHAEGQGIESLMIIIQCNKWRFSCWVGFSQFLQLFGGMEGFPSHMQRDKVRD